MTLALVACAALVGCDDPDPPGVVVEKTVVGGRATVLVDPQQDDLPRYSRRVSPTVCAVGALYPDCLEGSG